MLDGGWMRLGMAIGVKKIDGTLGFDGICDLEALVWLGYEGIGT